MYNKFDTTYLIYPRLTKDSISSHNEWISRLHSIYSDSVQRLLRVPVARSSLFRFRADGAVSSRQKESWILEMVRCILVSSVWGWGRITGLSSCEPVIIASQGNIAFILWSKIIPSLSSLQMVKRIFLIIKPYSVSIYLKKQKVQYFISKFNISPHRAHFSK